MGGGSKQLKIPPGGGFGDVKFFIYIFFLGGGSPLATPLCDACE